MYLPFSREDFEAFGIYKSSPFGYRDGVLHDGEDWAVNRVRYALQKILKKDCYIRASVDGMLTISDIDQYGGLYQIVEGIDGKSYMNVHQSSFIRHRGQVKAGEPIGIMGSTGNSTGVHTHFEVWETSTGKRINPSSLNLSLFNDPTEMIGLKHPVGCEVLKDTRLLKDYTKGRSQENTYLTVKKGIRFNAQSVAVYNGVEFYSMNIAADGIKYSGWVEAQNIRQYPTSDLAGRDRIIELDRENRKLKKQIEECC